MTNGKKGENIRQLNIRYMYISVFLVEYMPIS